MIPLVHRIKKEAHRKIAAAQDLIVEELYSVFNDAVFHGGTAIWRCYGGNRFSEDIDVYIKRDLEKINKFFSNLEKKGFIIEKKKISQNSLYSVLLVNRTYVGFEAIFKKAKSVLGEYETIESNLITVNVLSPEQLILEKIDTYLKRKKIRDLYDVFFLLRYVKDIEKIKYDLERFVKKAVKPEDEKELRVLLIEGLVPSYEKMIDYIKRSI